MIFYPLKPEDDEEKKEKDEEENKGEREGGPHLRISSSAN